MGIFSKNNKKTEPDKDLDEKTGGNDSVSFDSIEEYENYKKSITNKLLDEKTSGNDSVSFDSIEEYENYKKSITNKLLDEEISEEIHNIVTVCMRCDSQLTKEQKFCPNCGLEISLIKEYLSEDNKRVVDYKINTIFMEALHTVDKLNNLTDEEKFHMYILSVWEDTENKMINVVSSNIQSIGYDLETESLFVKFNNNFLYLYMEVPEKYYDDFLDASSKGKYHNKVIMNNFEYFNMTKIIYTKRSSNDFM